MARERQRDWLFEALCSACGIGGGAQIPTRERTKINVAVKDLREIGATPAEVLARAEVYKREFPRAALTPCALSGQWAFLGSKMPTQTTTRKSFKDLQEQCGLEGHTYADDATVVCGRCSRIVLARAVEICERFGHLPRTVKGVCLRCGDGATR